MKSKQNCKKLAFVTQPQLLRILKAARAAKSSKAERNWLMICVGYWHGLRLTEVLELRGTDVRDGYLMVRRKKGSLATLQKLVRHSNPLLNEASALIRAAAEAGEKAIFPLKHAALDRIFRTAAEDAGVPAQWRHFHVLKHSLAHHLIQSSVGLEKIRQRLGHKSLASTGQYLRVSDDDADDAVATALVKGKR